MIDWSQVDWAVVLATFCGPVLAVLITLWHQGRSARKDAQRSVYATMMRYRRHPTSLDFVGAFNLVPVHFHNNKVVMEKYNRALDILNDPLWSQREATTRLNENFQTAIAHLLSNMSRAVGLPVEQITILNGAYAPQGWADDEQDQRTLRHALIGVLIGARPLPVYISDEKKGSRIEHKPEAGVALEASLKTETDNS
ncbi:hypothetical protein K7H22_07355 [Seohaeicola saemankumensis]|uniref:DUF6680 family protein n=1 Tax=Seohaeicola saemankumensis TaxID=481181 RepID=UPI001E36D8EC|nr:DUF6680 family protein [Seohaeicola saemankumensis]MCD1625800.1 hypothetical protein [Seohaeicola saemankumensis]